MDGQFFWMLEMGITCSFLALMTPLGWLPTIVALLSGIRAKNAGAWPPRTWIFLAWPTLVSEILTALGMIYWRDSDVTVPTAATLLTNLTLGAYVLGATLMVYFHRALRPATCAVLSLGALPVLGWYFVAGMAITGSLL